MPLDSQSKPTFSPRRKWSIAFNVVFIVLLVFSVVGMVNYLSSEFPHRFHWSARSHVELSPLTKKFLDSLTNQVRIIIYYNKDEGLYPIISSLLNEYRLINNKISIETVDYLHDPGGAQKIKEEFKLAATTDKNLVIFSCAGRRQVIPGEALAKYVMEQVPSEKDFELRRHPTEFYGERWFTSSLLAVVNAEPLNAYVLQAHGEHPIDGGDENFGYLTFASILNQYFIRIHSLSLMDTNPIPADCNVIIIPGPQQPLFEPELDKLEEYLTKGGRLLVLFNGFAYKKDLGLEKLLAKWGVEVGHDMIVDPDHRVREYDVVVRQFSNHPIVNPLMDSSLYLIRPRSVSKLNLPNQAADAPKVEELASSGPRAFAVNDPLKKERRVPFIVAVEKAAPKGVVSDRGTTRIVVVGESLFLANETIKQASNSDFAGFVINWLLDRTQLLEAVGPQPVQRYKLIMTRSQLQKTQWLLLGAMPGSLLGIGGLVWVRRRR